MTDGRNRDVLAVIQIKCRRCLSGAERRRISIAFYNVGLSYRHNFIRKESPPLGLRVFCGYQAEASNSTASDMLESVAI